MIKKNLSHTEVAIRMILEDAKEPLSVKETTERVNKLLINGNLLYLIENGVIIANIDEKKNVMTFIHKDGLK